MTNVIYLDVVKRIVAWNSLRYDQKYDRNLSEKLLLEELLELYSANNAIEVLDAIGDITFVTIGIMWKLGIENDDIAGLLYNTRDIEHGYDDLNRLCDGFLIEVQKKYELDLSKVLVLKMALHAVFITCSAYLTGLNMDGMLERVTLAICDSNDTKVIPQNKVDPTVKANLDKGQNYVPPTEALIKLLTEANKNASQ